MTIMTDMTQETNNFFLSKNMYNINYQLNMNKVDKFFAETRQETLKRRRDNMKIIGEAKTHIIYADYFTGRLIKFLKNKRTGELRVDVNDWARSFGYESIEALLSSSDGLDLISIWNRWGRRNPDSVAHEKIVI